MIRVFRTYDGVETLIGEVESFLRAAVLIEEWEVKDRITGEAAEYSASNIGGDEGCV